MTGQLKYLQSNSIANKVCNGPVYMVRKGHKYVALLQKNVPRVMILSQKLGKFIWQADTNWTVRDIYLRWSAINLIGRNIYVTVRSI